MALADRVAERIRADAGQLLEAAVRV